MAVHFEYDAAQSLLLITFQGELRDADLVDLYQKTQQCTARYSIERGILDGLNIQSFEATPEIIRSLAHKPSMFPEKSDRCIVVGQDALFGMARMYQMLGGESRERLRIVRTLQEAYDYLHVETPLHLEPIES